MIRIIKINGDEETVQLAPQLIAGKRLIRSTATHNYFIDSSFNMQYFNKTATEMMNQIITGDLYILEKR